MMKMNALNKINQSLLIAGLLALTSAPALAVPLPAPAVAVPNTFTAGGTIVADEMNANFSAVVDSINTLASTPASSLPDGVTAGDVLYWDGSVWKLTPAPPVSTASLALTLINGVPTWTATGGVSYAIGDTGPAGGIVFYTSNGGKHGLEAAPVDQADLTWGCVGTTRADVGSFSFIGAGSVIAQIVINTACTSPAIDATIAYSLDGYDDWYLPSRVELETMYSMRSFNANLPTAGIYWASSYQSNNTMFTKNMADGATYYYTGDIGNVYKVRAIRSF